MNHDAHTYSLYRPLYPTQLFSGLIRTPHCSSDIPLQILDIACGTGQSTAAFAESADDSSKFQIHACDPDPEMIDGARRLHGDIAQWAVAPAEDLPYPDAYFDAVTILSAYHWFDRERADPEILRVLRPGGRLLIAEYQFPTAPACPELNAWIRRGFNETWKFANQKPRGRLRDFTASLLSHPRVQPPRWDRLEMAAALKSEDLAGLLFSQARFIAHLNRLAPDSERTAYQTEVATHLAGLLPAEGALFDFRLTRVLASLA